MIQATKNITQYQLWNLMEKGKEFSVVIHSNRILYISREQGKCQNAQANLKPYIGDPRTIMTLCMTY